MGFATGQMKSNRIAESIDQGIWCSIHRATARWPGPYRLFLGAGTVLMGAHDGAVDHRVFIVRVGGQMLKNAFPIRQSSLRG
jgi:hypothetical protein